MAIPLALPLVPLAPGAAAAAGTFFIGSAAYIAQQVYGFRAPARAPSVPRTGGKAGGATLKELIADVIAGARIPVAFPPNPLGPQGALGLVGVLAAAGFLRPRLAQIWGAWANSTKPKPYQPEQGISWTDVTGTRGSGGGKVRVYYYSNATSTNAAGDNCTTQPRYEGPDSYMGEMTYGPGKVPIASLTQARPCGFFGIEIEVQNTAGVVEKLTRNGSGGSPPFVFQDWGYRLEFLNPIGTPSPADSLLPPGEMPAGFVKPEITPEPIPRTRPARVVPLPLTPGPTPQTQPQTDPLRDPVPMTPGPTAPPATAPQVPRRTVPLPVPGATPTKDGAIVPQPPAPIVVTPPDAHFPVPGAPPVTGNGPRPTPEGIAQELGRLEQKLARLSDPGPEGPGDGSDRLQLLADLIGRLIEFATSMTAGGGYGLSTPCEVDENGERIVTTVNYSGATNSLDVLGNKLDALAALIQVHKDLKQPNCKQPAAVGQPVTVNFVQVD